MFNCEEEVFKIAAVYIHRFASTGRIPLKFENVHRILFAACNVARKYHIDGDGFNPYYAYVAGVSPAELMDLDILFCEAIKYDLFISDFRTFIENKI
jgi:hypothetical protein